MNKNIPHMLEDTISLLDIVENHLTTIADSSTSKKKKQNDAALALETFAEIRNQSTALAYEIQSLRSRVKIAGRNLTEAFEQIMQKERENGNDGQLSH